MHPSFLLVLLGFLVSFCLTKPLSKEGAQKTNYERAHLLENVPSELSFGVLKHLSCFEVIPKCSSSTKSALWCDWSLLHQEHFLDAPIDPIRGLSEGENTPLICKKMGKFFSDQLSEAAISATEEEK